MLRPDFKKCETAVNELLLTQDIDQFPIDVRDFKFNTFIHFDTMQNYCNITGLKLSDLIVNDNLKDGFNVINSEMSLILYNDCIDCSERVQWTLAHELGHVLLGHKTDSGNDEVEAHFFASKLFMPDVVLHELIRRGISITPQFLNSEFGVSLKAAKKRLSTLSKQLSCFQRYSDRYTYEYDDIILNKFMKHINSVAPRRVVSCFSDEDELLKWMNYK